MSPSRAPIPSITSYPSSPTQNNVTRHVTQYHESTNKIIQKAAMRIQDRSFEENVTPLKDAYDYEHLMADPLYPISTKNKEKIKKIDMKTMELKRMEGLEDMATFLEAETEGTPTKEVDDQLL